MDQPPCGRWRWLDQPPVSESLSILPVPENPITPMPYLTAVRALSCGDESYAVIVSSREEFSNWLQNPEPGAELLEVVGLINDPEVWALAAQGTMPIPLDVILEDPAAEFSSLYRLVDVRNTRPVRVTIPARPGFKKALRLAVSLQLPVRILPGQPDAGVLTELAEAADFYLHDSMVDVPVEFFHSLFAAFCGTGGGTLWSFLEQDPAECPRRDDAGQALQPPDFVETHLTRIVSEGGECASCRWQPQCAGYFKFPESSYDCAGVKQLFAKLETAADELRRDVATHSAP